MTVSTAYSGNIYSASGSIAEVRAELNRINAKADKVRITNDGTDIVAYVFGSI